MKKRMNLLLFTACAVGTIAIMNRWIFKNAGAPTGSKFESLEYKWRHGRLRYVVAGVGEPVLLIHGLTPGCSLLEWEKLIETLSHNYRVYALDLLGYGESSKPNISYSSYLHASQINDFISDVIGSSVNAVASSGGAAVIMAACALKPELYNKLLLISPVGVSNSRPIRERRAIQALIDMPVIGTAIYNLLSSRMYYRYSLLKNLALPLDSPDEMHRSAHAGGVGNKYPIAAYVSDMMGFMPDAITTRVTLPIHVCWGTLNTANPLSNFRPMRNANIKLTVFGNSGLFPHKNQPKKFYRLCRFFFEQV